MLGLVVQEQTGRDDSVFRALKQIMLLMYRDQLKGPAAAIMRQLRLLAFRKPTGTKPRPVAIPNVLVRWAAKWALATTEYTQVVQQSQLGVGVRGGAEVIGHAARADLEGGRHVLCTDIANAFNTLSRERMFELVG